jgi:hypothetical protein
MREVHQLAHPALLQVNIHPLYWLPEISVLEQAARRGKVEMCETKKWLTLSACHTGLLGDYSTPVGSGRFRERSQDS